MSNIMKRFKDEQKETLWERDLYDGLYNTPDGNEGIYKSPDGQYFYAKDHRNGFTYNGESILRLLPEEVAKEALESNYDGDIRIEGIPYPVWNLTINNWI